MVNRDKEVIHYYLCFLLVSNTYMNLLSIRNRRGGPGSRHYLQCCGGKAQLLLGSQSYPYTNEQFVQQWAEWLLDRFQCSNCCYRSIWYMCALEKVETLNVTDVNWMLMGSSKESLLCRSISSLWCRLSPACITSSTWSIPGCLLSVTITISKYGNLKKKNHDHIFVSNPKQLQLQHYHFFKSDKL